MRRFAVLLCAVCLGLDLGCESDGGKSQWAEFWKDVRGENMQMRGGISGMNDSADHSLQPRSRD
jgi:hypothetical protein